MPRLHRQVMHLLLGEIAAGTLEAGTVLPREADLAAEHGVSRGVIRECMRGLEERGLVRVKHGRGATVLPATEWDTFDPDVLTALLERSDHAGVLGEYLECRAILEVEAAGLAAERAGPADVRALREAFATMTAAAERARVNPAAEVLYQEADIAFHRAITLGAGNRSLARITEPIHRGLAAAVQRLARPGERFERGLPEHERILGAIASGDAAGARRAMREHLATVERHLRDLEAVAVIAPSSHRR